MRQIGFVNEERDAARLGDYLLTLGIVSSIEETQGGAWIVWIEDENHLDRARAELEKYRANPNDPRYDAASGGAEEIRKRKDTSEKKRRQQFVDVRTGWGQPSQMMRPVTIGLAILSIIVSLFGTKLGLVEEPTNAVENAMLIAPTRPIDGNFVTWDRLDAITHGQVWRLVTPIFLHFHPLHLLFNMFWLLDLGSMIERRRGSLFLLAMVIVTAAVSNVGEYYIDTSLTEPFRASPMFGGMSGVNYALFGYAWIKGKFQPHLGVGVSQQTIVIMLVWLVVCMVPNFMPRVANVAHVAGLLGGVAFAYVPYAFRRLRKR